jgi:hypothetical protein
MAERANWVRMSSVTGGVGTLTLAAITNYPTFTQGFGSGSSTVKYLITSTGKREGGIGTFDATAGTLARDTVRASWQSGEAIGTAKINFPTSGVIISCAPLAEDVLEAGDAISYGDLSDIPTEFTPESHTHAISEVTDLQTTLDAKAEDLGDLGDVTNTTPADSYVPVYNEGTETFVTRQLATTDLSDAATVEGSNGDFLVKVDGQWANRTAAQARSDIGLALGGIPIPLDTAPVNGTVYLCLYAPRAGTITALTHQLTSGSVSVAIQIGGVSVTGLSAISPSSKTTTSASAANTFVAGDVISLVYSSASTPVNFAGFLHITW